MQSCHNLGHVCDEAVQPVYQPSRRERNGSNTVPRSSIPYRPATTQAIVCYEAVQPFQPAVSHATWWTLQQ